MKLVILAILAALVVAAWRLKRDSEAFAIEDANLYSRRAHDPALVYRDPYLDELAGPDHG